jgi:adenylate cyclase
MTFLFTDIASFTTMAEGAETGVLTRVLNSYLDGITGIVHKHRGIVDKFIGNAVFAIFNAPVDQPHHADCAVKCGLEMDRFSESFRVERKAENVDLGNTRIGINTGMAVVENFGSKARYDYTAQGDAANTAARLEGLNKYLGTHICVSSTTQELCESMTFRPIASVVLKGKTTPVGIWEPLEGNVQAEELLERCCDAYTRIDEDGAAALELFSALHGEAPDDPCISLHLERLKKGVFGTAIVMTEK